MHRNRDEGFEIDFGVSACELKVAATVGALTIAVMMNVFSDIPLDVLSTKSVIIVPCYCTIVQ